MTVGSQPVSFLDSGCSNHLLSRNQTLTETFLGEPISVSTAGNDVLQIEKRGTAILDLIDGAGKTRRATLANSLISPNLDFNLISVSRLDKAGCAVHFEKGVATVVENGLVIASGAMNAAGLYPLLCVGTDQKADVNFAMPKGEKIKTTRSILDRRFGHPSGKTLEAIAKMYDIQVSPQSTSRKCEACILGKIT